MKSHKVIYISLFGIILLFGIFVLYQRLQAQRAFNVFLKESHLKQQDIIYQSVEKPLTDEGLILYGVIFPQLKLAHKINKMIVRKQGNEIVLQLQGVQIDVPQSLYARYGKDFVNALKVYKPFEDALQKPFISLGLMGIDTIKGDVVLIFDSDKIPITVNSRISLPKLGEIQLSFHIEPLLDDGFRKNLIYTGYGHVSQINVDIQDTGMFKSYAAYLNSLGTVEAEAYAKELMRHSGFTRRVTYPTPLSLASFYKPINK